MKRIFYRSGCYGRAHRPHFRLDSGKDGIPRLNGLEVLLGLARNLAAAFKVPPGIEQRAKLIEVSIETLFGVVARMLRGDKELPIRRFQEHQLAANLLCQSRAQFILRSEERRVGKECRSRW